MKPFEATKFLVYGSYYTELCNVRALGNHIDIIFTYAHPKLEHEPTPRGIKPS